MFFTARKLTGEASKKSNKRLTIVLSILMITGPPDPLTVHNHPRQRQEPRIIGCKYNKKKQTNL